MSINSTIRTNEKQVMKVYAATEYNLDNPRITNLVLVNIPEFTPTVPRDSEIENISIAGSYFVNQNFPNSGGIIQVSHAIEVPLLRGTYCPIYFPKDTEFLLLTPTGMIDDGYLIYI